MELDEIRSEGQPDARAFRRATDARDAMEAIDHLVQIFARNADSGVGDAEADRVLGVDDANGDHTREAVLVAVRE